MVIPALWREIVAWAQRAYQLSERREGEGSRGISVLRSAQERTELEGAPSEADPGDLGGPRELELPADIHTLLRREGWEVNHKLAQRLYREEGLSLRRKRLGRRRMAIQREKAPRTTRLNEHWAMDFMHDRLSNGGTVRVFAAVGVHTRECVALRAGRGFEGEDVAAILAEAASEGAALPDIISVDQGTEFTSKSLGHWAYWNQVRLDFRRPGKPTDNAFAEAFNSLLRRECLSQHYFIDLEDAQRILNRWRADYNNFRPHGSLARSMPVDFAAGAVQPPGPEKLEKLQFT